MTDVHESSTDVVAVPGDHCQDCGEGPFTSRGLTAHRNWRHLWTDERRAEIAASMSAGQQRRTERERERRVARRMEIEEREQARAAKRAAPLPAVVEPAPAPAVAAPATFAEAAAANDLFGTLGRATDALFPDRVPSDRILEVAELQMHMITVLRRGAQ